MKVVNIEHRHGHIKKNNLENEKYFKDSFHFMYQFMFNIL